MKRTRFAEEQITGILRRVVAEAVGTALLLTAVVGSGIMGERLAGGNLAVVLLANSLATGATLVILILIFGEVSGAHFNPAVTLVLGRRANMSWGQILYYMIAQVLGAMGGVWIAHAMFGEPILMVSSHVREGYPQIFAESIATFGLLLTILSCVRNHPRAVPAAVGLYIMAAYWFTASTSFANPAVTLARGLTDTFTGIRPQDIPGFIVAQLIGAIFAMFLFRFLFPDKDCSQESL
ncbi:MAG: aquaporin family protein [Deltaproteobacteria bacterium]|nr:aquaporin family protein [Deltaproteobacteria bacterium]MBI2500511.1 aquaporin family protein [Deltaproteobacteria bacterium]